MNNTHQENSKIFDQQLGNSQDEPVKKHQQQLSGVDGKKKL